MNKTMFIIKKSYMVLITFFLVIQIDAFPSDNRYLAPPGIKEMGGKEDFLTIGVYGQGKHEQNDEIKKKINVIIAWLKENKINKFKLKIFNLDPQNQKDLKIIIAVAKFCAQQDGLSTAYFFNKFRLTVDNAKDAIIEIVKLCAQENGWGTAIHFKNFGLTIENARDAVIKIIKLFAQYKGGTTASILKKIGLSIDNAKDKDIVIEIAKLCAQQDGGGTAIHFKKNFGLTVKNTKDAVIEIAKLCAQQNGGGTAEYFKNFGLTVENARDAVIEIAKLCAQQDGWGTAIHFKNFGLTIENVRDAIIEIAKLCAQQNGERTAEHFKNFGLTVENARDAVVEIAKLCAQQDGCGTAQHFANFGLEIFPEEALDYCLRIERKYMSNLSKIIAKTSPLAKLIDGQHQLESVDVAYSTLKIPVDKDGLSIGAQSYIKLLLLEEVMNKQMIDDSFVHKLNTETIPALLALETFTKKYPTLGMEPKKHIDFNDVQEKSLFLLQVKLANYLRHVKVNHHLGDSFLDSTGRGEIRIAPATYPVFILLINKMYSLGIVDTMLYSSCVAGAYAKEAMFLLTVLFYANYPAGTALPIAPDTTGNDGDWLFPGVGGMFIGVTIDPWTGEILDKQDKRTRGMQMNFFHSAIQIPVTEDSYYVPFCEDLRRTFLLVSAAGTYLGEYGLDNQQINGIYHKFKNEIKRFMFEKLKFSAENFEKIREEQEEPTRNEKGIISVLRKMEYFFRINQNDDHIQQSRKIQLHAEFKKIVEKYTEEINSAIFKETMNGLADEVIEKGLGIVKNRVLSACFDIGVTRKETLRVARIAYPEEYQQITERTEAYQIGVERTNRCVANSE